MCCLTPSMPLRLLAVAAAAWSEACALDVKARRASEDVAVRVVDAAGSQSHVGLLQVRTGDGSFGSVCGLSSGAADVVCRQLGGVYFQRMLLRRC